MGIKSVVADLKTENKKQLSLFGVALYEDFSLLFSVCRNSVRLRLDVVVRSMLKFRAIYSFCWLFFFSEAIMSAELKDKTRMRRETIHC